MTFVTFSRKLEKATLNALVMGLRTAEKKIASSGVLVRRTQPSVTYACYGYLLHVIQGESSYIM
jgi:hypothetical protein